ncbi:putative leucine-rich repeat receptor-like serine/threonine-protein kinase At2g19230 [Typha latifolia]|uniref:putative leucine-rich repeat receptor-like serine/threonine-protein kinase At2g19230 n=1 Tax=Typha latifolia TaxID=4733 RepID=UPI003C2FCFA9
MPYNSDTQFIDTGTNYRIATLYIKPSLDKQLLSLRSFPNGTRNCYTLKSLDAGLKYLIRATFLYGNYDGLNKLPTFDIYFGINYWKTISISTTDAPVAAEVIAVIPDNQVQVCMINTGLGTPFISGLELRPLKSVLYPAANATQAIILFSRVNAGPTDNTVIRYPIDPYDRIWRPWNTPPVWAELSSTSTIQNLPNDHFEVPSSVMQTAVTPANSSRLQFYWIPDPKDKNPGYISAFHFFELNKSKALREFNIYLHDKLWYVSPVTPDNLYSGSIYGADPAPQYSQYNVSVIPTSKSELPPIINALEIFSVAYITGTATDSGDVNAIMAIKEKYKVNRGWMGDPCAPQAYAWEGLNCSFDTSNTPRITTLNLSSSGLTGDITTSFANLKAIQYLDLSHNSLTGSIPDELSNLRSLKLLDLTSNQLSGSIPADLLKRSQDGSLVLRIGDNRDLCANENSCELPPKKKSPVILIIVIVVVVVLVLLIAVIPVLYIRRKWQGMYGKIIVAPHIDNPLEEGSDNAGNLLQLENRQFKYNELVGITENFRREIGRGGFGKVYRGFLENGTEVAVKMRNQSSSQGVQEFLAEAKHLTQVHHKNLVSMIGYCKDGDHLGLVYEYMPEGTLRDHLKDEASSDRHLSWQQRLNIALESAQGLKYLHSECKPQLIHRDVKTSNILLSGNLVAKIADFGLSKAFNGPPHSKASTRVVGSPGYIDPEYCVSYKNLSEKSDVYSFGVVLLEVITGKPPILPESGVHITNWVHQELKRGLIENIIDPRMQGEYNVNSVWKVAELALACTAQTSNQRPTMTEVFLKLKEYFDLESIDERSHNMYSGDSNQYSRSNILDPVPLRSVSSDILYPVLLRSVSTTDGPQIR